MRGNTQTTEQNFLLLLGLDVQHLDTSSNIRWLTQEVFIGEMDSNCKVHQHHVPSFNPLKKPWMHKRNCKGLQQNIKTFLHLSL